MGAHFVKTRLWFDVLTLLPLDLFFWNKFWLHTLLRAPRVIKSVKVFFVQEFLDRFGSFDVLELLVDRKRKAVNSFADLSTVQKCPLIC